jgi:hypothetical protein
MLTSAWKGADAHASVAERREGARQRLMLRSAKLRCRSGEYLCVIHDVSEAGVKLRLFHAHPPDRHLFLELANGELYAMERRWIDGAFGGYRFSAPIELDEFVHETSRYRRRPVRLRIGRPVAVSAAGESTPAVLVNLSQHGACIDTGRQIAVRAPLRIEIPGSAGRFAHVCWRKDRRHGIVFQEALAAGDFASLALRLQPYGGAMAGDGPNSGPAYALSA